MVLVRARFDCAHRNTQCNGTGVFHALMVAFHVPMFQNSFCPKLLGKGYEPYKIAVEQCPRSVIMYRL